MSGVIHPRNFLLVMLMCLHPLLASAGTATVAADTYISTANPYQQNNGKSNADM